MAGRACHSPQMSQLPLKREQQIAARSRVEWLELQVSLIKNRDCHGYWVLPVLRLWFLLLSVRIVAGGSRVAFGTSRSGGHQGREGLS